MSSPLKPFNVGIFDSGVGGLSVLRAIRGLRPDVNIHFVADQGHVPYGSRPLEQVREFATGITNYLLEEGADLIVVACNAASAAALHSMRENFPQVPFVGMEPAVKPAANLSSTGTVGVLATPATFQGKLYASVVERFAANVQVLTSTCPGLVQRIEAGDLDGSATRSILEEALYPMLEAGADSIVLGCTHYPFVIPLIRSIVGSGIEIIDPSPAVARQVDRLLNEKTLDSAIRSLSGCVHFYTTGSPAKLSELSNLLIGESHPVHALIWESGKLTHASTGYA